MSDHTAVAELLEAVHAIWLSILTSVLPVTLQTCPSPESPPTSAIISGANYAPARVMIRSIGLPIETVRFMPSYSLLNAY